MRKIPSIANVMTPFPYSISATADISEARRMMDEHEIQHLPVMEGDELIGLLWDRDIRVAKALATYLPTKGIEVGRVCNRQPYVVDLGDRLDQVAIEMAHRRAGAAVVTRQGKLAGILTTTDVCRLLGETLRAEVHLPEDGGDAA